MMLRTLAGGMRLPWPALAMVLAMPFACGVPNGLAAGKGGETQAGAYKLTGPYTHENLTIYLIHGAGSKTRGRPFLTLQEALEQKKVVVHETGSVNELTVENVSNDMEVFIQSGDVVKGGRQDRLIAHDCIVPVRSGKLRVASYCVEQGRWTQRGKEAAAHFSSSTGQLASQGLRLNGGNLGGQGGGMGVAGAAGGTGFGGGLGFQGGGLGFQGGVWREVDTLQGKLQKKLGAEVRAGESKTSLPLTLENEKLQQAVKPYVANLSAIVDEPQDVIGYAFAINGKVSSAEVYASGELFKKLWPKLLSANAVESIAEREKDKPFPPATAAAVKAFLEAAEKGKPLDQDVSRRVKVVMRETDKLLFFETRDRGQKDAWIHRSYQEK